MPKTPRGVGLAWMLVPLLLGGCLDGGRGSSGFDLEAALIERVLTTQRCLSRDAVVFCPADQQGAAVTPTPTPAATPPSPGASPTPTATAAPLRRVDTGLANGASIACTRARQGDRCHLTFSFQALGFGTMPALRVAAQMRPPGMGWDVAPPLDVDPSADPPRYDAAVALAVPFDAQALTVRFAVLVLPAGAAALPPHLAALADSGAEFAFVTPELALEVITTDPLPTATATPSGTPAGTASATVPPDATPTATRTAVPTSTPAGGPRITHVGLARADSVPLAPSGVDAQGRPVYVRPLGSGFSLIVEGAPGANGARTGTSAYTPGALPALQLLVSRPLGNGSAVVCDAAAPLFGGVPATVPLVFGDAPAVVDAVNDLGCRVDDGRGEPFGRPRNGACTIDRGGNFEAVHPASEVQFCLPIAGAWQFPSGDTVVAVRLADRLGVPGPVREIVVRSLAAPTTPAPTLPPPLPTATRTRTVTAPPSATPSATGTPPTATATRTRTATATPRPDEDGPRITHFGLAHADDRPFAGGAFDAFGRPRFRVPFGYGFSLIVEAKPGNGAPGRNGYDPDGTPDVQLLVSRPLGDGSALVCDALPPEIGGVPRTEPLVFGDDPATRDAMNDLGCRINDGTGAPLGRLGGSNACTRSESGSGFGYGFVAPDTTVQYCLPVAPPWAFAPGDTIVAARVRGASGAFGPVREIVVRVSP